MTPTFTTAAIPLERLSESPLNYRSFFDEKRMVELTESIKLSGIKAPLLVRAIKDGKPWLDPGVDLLEADSYEIASGHRRFRASKRAGLSEVPVIVQQMTDDQFIELLSVEIVQHEGVHPLDEAAAFQNLLKRPGYDAAVIGARIGKEALYVQRRLSLLRMTAEARKAFFDNVGVNLAMAQILARLTPEDQKLALDRLTGKCQNWQAIKSSRQLQAFVTDELMMSLKKAPFDPKDPELVRGAGACGDCPKRTGFMPELFPDVEDGDICTDRTCFNKKKRAALTTTIFKFSQDHGFKPLLVSRNYEGSKEQFAGLPVISKSSYEVASKKKKCEFQKPALVVRGEEGLGKLIEVCANPRCKVHAGRYRHDETQAEVAARQKREFEEKLDKETRRGMLRAIVEAFERDPDSVARLEDLRLLAKKAFDGVRDQEYRKEMLTARGIDQVDGIEAWLRTAKPLALKTLALESALSRDLEYYGDAGNDKDEDPDDPDELTRAAKRWFVDVKAVRKQAEAGLKAKQKAEADRAAAALAAKEKKAQAKEAKGKTKAAAAAASVEEA